MFLLRPFEPILLLIDFIRLYQLKNIGLGLSLIICARSCCNTCRLLQAASMTCTAFFDRVFEHIVNKAVISSLQAGVWYIYCVTMVGF
jgi:hypothetical protein